VKSDKAEATEAGEASAVASLRCKTAPLLLADRARATPNVVAFRSKHLGIYRTRTWRDYAELVARCALGLATLDVGAGDRVAIIGDACEEWLIADLGAQAAGAVTYGIYPTASPTEVEYQLRDGAARVFVAENQEYVDKVLPFVDRLPDLRWIVVIDDSAMFGYRHPKLRRYADVLAAGDPGMGDAVAALHEMAMRIDPLAPAFIVYTSGTTGHPKGALVTHGKHLASTYNLVTHYPTLAERSHRTVVYLPLCHVLGRDVAITLPLLTRLVPHIGEDLEDLPQTLFEVAPTVLFTVPRYLQKFASQILIGIANSSMVKRSAYGGALRFARGYAHRRWDGRTGALRDLAYRLLHWAVFRPALNKLGFDRLELVVSGGAPLPAETMTLWQMWGVNVVEIYGQTETAGGIITGQRGPFARPGNVGTVPSGWRVRLGAENEIQVLSPDLFEGYWSNPEATAAVLEESGWLRTGDVGEWVGENLKLVDRVRDFIVTSGGKTLSPSYIENIGRASPFVAEIVVFGHARKYVTALIEIDFDTVADWARARGVPYTGFTSLAQHPDVERLLAAEIEKANAQLARVEQIKVFRVIPKALDPEEEGEPITPTRKVKRKQMYERFRELVDAMYDDAEERLVAQGVAGIANKRT